MPKCDPFIVASLSKPCFGWLLPVEAQDPSENSDNFSVRGSDFDFVTTGQPEILQRFPSFAFPRFGAGFDESHQ